MALTKTHDLHKRRSSRNVGVALCLVAFAALMFGLTIAKVSEDGPTQGFDHVVRPELELKQ